MKINNKKLIKEFFKYYKPVEKNNVLIIPKANKEFENIFGKKAPYKLVFSLSKYNITPGSELIAKGSYFLSSMKEYMDNKGQTSLIKLKIIVPLTIKNKIRLGNCFILKTQNKNKYDFLNEFTFVSSYTALNEKKQFFKQYLIKEFKILDIDLTKYKTLKKDPKEIPNLDIQKQFKKIKNNFKKLAYEDTLDLRINLKEKLKEQLQRIKVYYSNQIKEKDDEISICKNKVNNLKKELKKTFYERDKETIKRNIRDSETRLIMLSNQGYKERLKKEEDFHIKDEIDKHTLIIENKLVNATIYYYPIPIFSLSLNNKLINNSNESLKTIEISYDPIFEKFDYNSLVCESCKKNNIKQINLCKKGKHLCCKTCINKCKVCNKYKK